jgi:N-acylneuraminate cytidylyltransferase
MKPIAIIPARGGSKRIPRKNIQFVGGMPMIARAITTAVNSKIFSEVIVSTDDEEIAKIARNYGAHVPQLRRAELSDDYATTYDVIADALSYSWIGEKKPEHICCIYPSSIFLSVSHLINAYQMLISSGCSYVFPVQEYSPPIQRGLHLNENGRVTMLHPENLLKRTQDFHPTYHDTGQFYWGKRKAWESKESIFGPDSRGLISKTYEFIDIDTPEDLEIAKLLFDARAD